MKTMFKSAIILMMALGSYAFSAAQAQGTQSQKGGAMVIILGDKSPIHLEFNACYTKANSPKQITILDDQAKIVFDQVTEGGNITISTSSFSAGVYTIRLDTGTCQEEASVEIYP